MNKRLRVFILSIVVILLFPIGVKGYERTESLGTSITGFNITNDILYFEVSSNVVSTAYVDSEGIIFIGFYEMVDLYYGGLSYILDYIRNTINAYEKFEPFRMNLNININNVTVPPLRAAVISRVGMASGNTVSFRLTAPGGGVLAGILLAGTNQAFLTSNLNGSVRADRTANWEVILVNNNNLASRTFNGNATVHLN